jgi:hypothetical protein
MMANDNALFLDTTIQIARFVHGQETKRRIENRLAGYSLTITGYVVKQEFKRRLLVEADYLLGVLNKYDSLDDVFRHVRRLSHPQQKRKLNICLDMLGFVFQNAGAPELKERLALYLHYLLTLGLKEFESMVGHVVRASGCACAKTPILEKARGKRYEFGTSKCSKTESGACEIAAFIEARTPEMTRILDYLRTVPAGNNNGEKSAELVQAEEFIESVIANPKSAMARDPCYTVGDLLNALESVGIPVFFTMNGKESQHLCRSLGQKLIVLRNNPEKADVVCLANESDWPKF